MHIDALKILRTYIDGEGNITYKVKLADGRRVRVNNTELIDLVSKYKCINASITPTYPLRVKKIYVENGINKEYLIRLADKSKTIVNESELIELLKNNKFDNATLSPQGVVHIDSTVPRAPYNYVRDANTYYVTARYGEYYTIISGSKKLELRVHRTLLELMFERGCKFGNACLTPNHKVKVDGTIDKTVGNLLSIRVPVQYIRYSVDNHWYMVAYDKPAPQGVFLFDEDSISAMRQHIKRYDARIDAVKTKSAMMKKYYFCLLGKIYVEDFQNMDTHERTVNLLAVRVSILRDYIKTGGISCRDFLTLLFDESDIRTDKNWDILTHWESDGIKLDRFELFAEYVRFMLDLSAYFEEEGSICSKVILMQ